MLGSGTSTGVPRIGDDWGACDPANPKNRRTRVSIIVENNAGQRILVDTSPDLREQLLANAIGRIDAVFWTHDHADHCHGIDDLRALRFGRSNAIPGFASEATARRLRSRFGYVFAGENGYPTIVELHAFGASRMTAGFRFETCEMNHGSMTSTGILFEADGKTIAYATDFGDISDEMVALFMGADLLISDCLRHEPHPTHANLSAALDLARRCNVGRTVLTHLDKSMDYAALTRIVPRSAVVGYDGLEIVCE